MAWITRRKEDLPERSLWQRIKDVALLDVAVLARGGVSPGSLEKLEEILLEADFGVSATLKLIAEVERRAARGEIRSHEEFLEALREGVEASLRAGNSRPAVQHSLTGPTVVLVVGV